jgi:hypothetical protein
MELPVGKQDKEFWQGHVEAAENFSGSMSAYCKQNGLAQSQFCYYRKKFLKKSKFAEVKPVPAPVAEVRQKESTSQQQKLPDAKWLAALIRELVR